MPGRLQGVQLTHCFPAQWEVSPWSFSFLAPTSRIRPSWRLLLSLAGFEATRASSRAGVGSRVTPHSWVLGMSLRTSQCPSDGPSDPQVPLLSLVMLGSLGKGGQFQQKPDKLAQQRVRLWVRLGQGWGDGVLPLPPVSHTGGPQIMCFLHPWPLGVWGWPGLPPQPPTI